MPVCKDREYRSLAMPLVSVGESKRLESDYYVEGYATTFNTPYMLYEIDNIKYYEIIDKNALNGADCTDVIMQYDHTGKVFARKSNHTLGLEATDKGLFIFADLSKSPAAKELYEEIQNGLVTKMSWAFKVLEENYNADSRTRTILKIQKVYDVSAVSLPANEDTEISARSFIQGRLEKERQELLERRKKILKVKLKIMEV